MLETEKTAVPRYDFLPLQISSERAHRVYRVPYRDNLIRKAQAVGRLGERPARSLQDAYTVAFWLAERLHRRYPDTRIMVGDDSHGRIQHWSEIPGLKTYVDPAHDASEDSGPPVLLALRRKRSTKRVIETSSIPTLTSKRRGTNPSASMPPTLQNRCTKTERLPSLNAIQH